MPAIATTNKTEAEGLTGGNWLVWALAAPVSFHAAHISGISWLLVPCAYALIELSRAGSQRKVFYPMLAIGFLFYAPQLGFFRGLFGAAAVALWLVLAFWVALSGLILHKVRVRHGNGWMLALAPFIWTGLEYFRCELYPLRFGWLTFGMSQHALPRLTEGAGAFLLGTVLVACAAQLQLTRNRSNLNTLLLLGFVTAAGTLISLTGAPAQGFFVGLMACAGIIQSVGRPLVRLALALVCLLVAIGVSLPELGKSRAEARPKHFLHVAGIQLEFPEDHQVLSALNQARAKFPGTQLFMLSEYTFQNPVPQAVRDWCASNQVYLVAGGKEPLGDTNFYNMAYVIGTNGAIVHQQAKSVPIQFFQDGLPAPERKVWDSPWGRIGILTCYDLSYTRVVDDFVRQGAIALLNPTMDVAEWGEAEHKLHARVVPIRAAEYGIPIFRVASSGISQLVSHTGRVIAMAPFRGEGDIISGQLPLNARPRRPLDRLFAPFCVGITALALAASLIPLRKRNQSTSP